MPGHRVALGPGQGAQTVGMGKAWHDASPEARAIFDRAAKVVGSRLGVNFLDLCFAGPVERLNQTDASQPALFVAGVASWHGLCARWGVAPGPSESGLAAAAGLSLGEYTALHLAGAFSFEDGLELVLLRGRAMQDAADEIKLASGERGSGMVALIGADETQARAVCDAARQGSEVLVPANFNAPGQIVISGSIAACTRALATAESMGLKATSLAVAGAFHSPLMAPAAERLREALDRTPVRAPACPVLSNVTGRPHDAAGSATLEAAIRRRLVEQLTHPVRWAEGCGFLAASAGSLGAREFHELAPGKTLAGLMRRIDKSVKVETHDDPGA